MKTNLCVRAIALLAVLALKACGGSGADNHQQTGAGRLQAASGKAEALFAQDGRPSAAARQPPPGYGQRTRAGLYATPEQFAWEALTVEPFTVLVDVDAHASPDAAIDKTLRDLRWSGDAARAAAFYVRAADARAAVAVADELTASGVPLVFVIAQATR
jgi:hypothetical protein